MKPITWKTIRKPLNWLKPTPKNYKLAVEDGSARVDKSLEKYGFAGSMIANQDGTLINGNSRTKKLVAKYGVAHVVEISVPSRKLTPKEVQEFAAIFDFSRAGETDLVGIKKDYGSNKDFMKAWGIILPKEALANIKALEKAQIVAHSPKGPSKQAQAANTSRPVTLLFLSPEYKVFNECVERLNVRAGTDNVTDLIFKMVKKVDQAKQFKLK